MEGILHKAKEAQESREWPDNKLEALFKEEEVLKSKLRVVREEIAMHRQSKANIVSTATALKTKLQEAVKERKERERDGSGGEGWGRCG